MTYTLRQSGSYRNNYLCLLANIFKIIVRIPRRRMKQPSVHIVPVGFEYDRIVAPMLEYPVDELVLLRSKNEEYPGEHSLEDHFLDKLKQLPVKIRSVDLDIYDFEGMFRDLSSLLKQELALGKTVLVNLSAAPRLELVAIVMAASMCRHLGPIRLLYVKPQEYRQGRMVDALLEAATRPSEGSSETMKALVDEFLQRGMASGVKETLELSPLPVEPISETERRILEGLAKGDVESLKELVQRVKAGKRKVPRSNVVYHLEALKRKDMVSVVPEGKKVKVGLRKMGELFLETECKT